MWLPILPGATDLSLASVPERGDLVRHRGGYGACSTQDHDLLGIEPSKLIGNRRREGGRRQDQKRTIGTRGCWRASQAIRERRAGRHVHPVGGIRSGGGLRDLDRGRESITAGEPCHRTAGRIATECGEHGIADDHGADVDEDMRWPQATYL